VKLQWNAKSKVGSLDNTTYKPGGGDKKIETMKLDFKDKAKPKVGSKENAKHTPGGGTVKVRTIGTYGDVICSSKPVSDHLLAALISCIKKILIYWSILFYFLDIFFARRQLT